MSVRGLCLAILSYGDATGYEIRKESTEGRFSYFDDASFGSIYPALAAQYGAALFPDFLKGLSDLPDRDQVVARFLQPDGLHPNAQGVSLVVAAMGPEVLEWLDTVGAR